MAPQVYPGRCVLEGECGPCRKRLAIHTASEIKT